MRIPACLSALALLGVACRESPVSPYYTPSGPAPTGLAASLLPGSRGERLTRPTIDAMGDSVVAAAELSASGCSDYSARAGMADGVLVVTIVDSLTPRFCTLPTTTATFRAVVRSVPSGRYDVVLRTRTVPPSQPAAERELARRNVQIR